jgi:hypothetical protein
MIVVAYLITIVNYDRTVIIIVNYYCKTFIVQASDNDKIQFMLQQNYTLATFYLLDNIINDDDLSTTPSLHCKNFRVPEKARAFVNVRHFHPSLIFIGKAKRLPPVATPHSNHFIVLPEKARAFVNVRRFHTKLILIGKARRLPQWRLHIPTI